MKIRVVLATISAILLFPVLSAAGDMIIIGNPSVSTSELRKQDVKYIFLGMKTKWNDGSKIVFVIQKDSDTHKNFLENYIMKTPFQFSNYWKKQIFTGKGSSPQSLESDQAIINFVSETNGAIGYVSSSTSLDNVKSIRIK